MILAQFKRGRDKKPRKRRLARALRDARTIASDVGVQGIGAAGIGATTGLLVRPNSAPFQRKLAAAGLLAGGAYGLSEGIKKARSLRQREKFTKPFSASNQLAEFRRKGNKKTREQSKLTLLFRE